MTDDLLEEGLQVFAEESRELLEMSEGTLLRLEDNPEDSDLIDELFRSIHTIKGSAGIFGFDQVVSFTHQAESVLGRIREGELGLSEDLLTVMLESRDHISTLVEHTLGGGGELSDDVQQVDDNLMQKLQVYLDGGVSASPAGTEAAAETEAEVPAEAGDSQGQTVESEYWHLSLRYGKDVLRNGMDPLSFFRYLSTVGDIVSLTVMGDDIPEFTKLDPEECYLGFELDLKSEASKEEIAAVFEFVQDDCVIHILPPGSLIADYTQLIDELPEEPLLLGDILVRTGALTRAELDEALSLQDDAKQKATEEAEESGEEQAPTAPLGEVLVEQGMANTPVVEAALKKQKQVKETQAIQQQTVRVNAEKLGDLINLVGELVISSAHTELQATRSGDENMLESISHMSRLVEEIRDSTLGLRMVQIGDTFNRFRRVVRDLSQEFKKNIDLKISGGETELDKTVVEKIGDPLMHLVRNSMDHGIETPAVREENGKPGKGTLSLNAYHDSGSIVIEIEDDGAGLNIERIMNKAIENGILTEGQQLSEQEAYRLIFEAGFSTAEKVTSVSGRGVGMDVVRRNIEALRGQIDVTSEAGYGTKFTIRLPLTLAIIDGFQVHVGQSSYVIPLDLVDECIELSGEMHEADEGGNYINLRGEVLPYVRLSDMFGENREGTQKRDNIVVVQFAGQKAGLVVDELLGEHQTVIKPLSKIFQNVKGLSGATILGSGEVAMIIDVPALVQQVSSNNEISAIH